VVNTLLVRVYIVCRKPLYIVDKRGASVCDRI